MITRGNRKQDVFSDRTDYAEFIRRLLESKLLFPFILHAFCLMPNHVHLLIQVKDDPLSRFMQRILSLYAQYFNRRNNLVGHVFHGRYKAFACQKNSYFVKLVRYIHLNPVRANIVQNPHEWRWSSHAEYMSNAKPILADPETLLSMLGSDRAQAKKRYADLIAANEEFDESFGVTLRVAASAGGISRNRLGSLRVSRDNCDESLDSLAAKTSVANGLPVRTLKGPLRLKEVVDGRRDFIHRAISQGYHLSEIARFLHRSVPGIIKLARPLLTAKQDS